MDEAQDSARAISEAATVTRTEAPADDSESAFEGMVGASAPMLELFRLIDRFAELEQHVLIFGETGTGKELVARAIHNRSGRKDRRFLAVNCAATPGPLFEAEFFGHERGAFTGAELAREGWFEAASRGTLFLDELGELPMEMQAKLLRVVDQHEVTRIGARQAKPTNVRIVAATNVDLSEAVAVGTFRQDLFWRLKALSLHVPPVRERGDDVMLLAEHLIRRLRVELRRPMVTVTRELLPILRERKWPGNVREIEHFLRDAIVRAEGDVLDWRRCVGLLRAETSTGSDGNAALPPGVTLTAGVAEVTRRLEAQWIAAALSASQGSHVRTAQALGIDVRTLSTKIRQYKIPDAFKR